MTGTLDRESDLARCEELLRLAAQADNMAERGRLIDEAYWLRFRANSAENGATSSELPDPALDWDEPADQRPARGELA